MPDFEATFNVHLGLFDTFFPMIPVQLVGIVHGGPKYQNALVTCPVLPTWDGYWPPGSKLVNYRLTTAGAYLAAGLRTNPF